MAAREIAVRLEPRAGSPATWELYDDNFPEGSRHRENVDLLRDVLRAWSCQGEHRIVCNLAIRWDRANPKVGVDPEVCVISAATPCHPHRGLVDLRTWLPGHATPPLATAALRGETAKREAELAKLTG